MAPYLIGTWKCLCTHVYIDDSMCMLFICSTVLGILNKSWLVHYNSVNLSQILWHSSLSIYILHFLLPKYSSVANGFRSDAFFYFIAPRFYSIYNCFRHGGHWELRCDCDLWLCDEGQTRVKDVCLHWELCGELPSIGAWDRDMLIKWWLRLVADRSSDSSDPLRVDRACVIAMVAVSFPAALFQLQSSWM
jgi:hypothetical protein